MKKDRSTVNIIKRLTLVVTALLVLSSFSSCQSTPSTTENGTADLSTTGDLIMLSEGKTQYKVIYSPNEKKADEGAAAVSRIFSSMTNTDFTVCEDTLEPGEYEILVGKTNRPETEEAKALLGDKDYIITVIGNKLVIYGKNTRYYTTASKYLENVLFKDGDFTVKKDFIYRGSLETFIKQEEKIDGYTVIDLTFNPENAYTQAGIFIGKEWEDTVYGYLGYAFILTKTDVEFWRFGTKNQLMASRPYTYLQGNTDIKLRLEVDKFSCKAYVLDDENGLEPWPEFEMSINNSDGLEIFCFEKSGRGSLFKECAVTHPEKEKTGTLKYTNPIYNDYADPDVFYHDGTYYLYATGGNGYIAHTSKDLVSWSVAKRVAEANLWGITRWYWAPDIEYVNGKYYMVVSCDEKLGMAVSDSPLGPFKEHSKDILFEKTIDGHIFVDDDGKVYLYYVSWRKSYGLYGVELDENMMPIMSTEKRIIAPTEDWEKKEGNVTEGPYMLKHNGLYYMTYSGSSYLSIDYAVGYAVSDSPLGDFKKYEDNPIMIGNSQVHGVGHHCIAYTPDKSEMIIVYHCHNNLSAVQVRKICIDRIRFAPTKNGIDKLEVYGPTTTPQPYPKIN